MYKQANCDLSTYYAEFQRYAADVQWNDPAKYTTLLRGLNTEIKDTLAMSNNVPQELQEFVAFLQWLDN
jgi:hypothetical protein